MSDEQPKNVSSVPPPTDEIDQEWGATPAPPGAVTKSSPTASAGKPATSAAGATPVSGGGLLAGVVFDAVAPGPGNLTLAATAKTAAGQTVPVQVTPVTAVVR